MLPGVRTPDGSLYITTAAPSPLFDWSGIAHGPLGAIYASSTLPPQTVVNGFGVRDNGVLCIRYGYDLSQAVWIGGLPFDDEGRLCCQLNQPESPGDSFVGGIRVGPLGGVYVTDFTPVSSYGFSNGFSNGFNAVPAGGGSTFTPLDLFADGEIGVWYDPSDFSTLFQDSAGTIPVTAVGQTVGKILDKSGNNIHATQATAASRPALQQDSSGKYHLAFDGVDDYLASGTLNLTATDKLSVFGGYYITAVPGGGVVSSYLHTGGFAVLAATANDGFRADLKNTTTVSAIVNIGTKAVFDNLFDTAGATATDEIKTRINGINTETVVSPGPTSGNFESFYLQLGNWIDSFPLNGRIYSGIVRSGLSPP